MLGWTDIAAVAISPFHTVGVKTDGTVAASGDIQYGQCQVEDWTDIQAAAAGEVPVGCVIVSREGEILGRGRNRREGDHDPLTWTAGSSGRRDHPPFGKPSHRPMTAGHGSVFFPPAGPLQFPRKGVYYTR